MTSYRIGKTLSKAFSTHWYFMRWIGFLFNGSVAQLVKNRWTELGYMEDISTLSWVNQWVNPHKTRTFTVIYLAFSYFKINLSDRDHCSSVWICLRKVAQPPASGYKIQLVSQGQVMLVGTVFLLWMLATSRTSCWWNSMFYLKSPMIYTVMAQRTVISFGDYFMIYFTI